MCGRFALYTSLALSRELARGTCLQMGMWQVAGVVFRARAKIVGYRFGLTALCRAEIGGGDLP